VSAQILLWCDNFWSDECGDREVAQRSANQRRATAALSAESATTLESTQRVLRHLKHKEKVEYENWLIRAVPHVCMFSPVVIHPSIASVRRDPGMGRDFLCQLSTTLCTSPYDTCSLYACVHVVSEYHNTYPGRIPRSRSGEYKQISNACLILPSELRGWLDLHHLALSREDTCSYTYCLQPAGDGGRTGCDHCLLVCAPL
jgi:hypothetical protein